MIPAAALLAAWCAAQEPPALSSAAPSPARWVRQASSLLRHDAGGDLAEEIGLGRWEEGGASGLSVRETRGDAAPGGRFAWIFDKKTSWNPAKTRLLAVERNLRLLGASGAELWASAEADAPSGGEPLAFSADGETLALALRRPQGWFISLRSYIGNAFLEEGPFPSLTAVAIAPGGRYALARWIEIDKSATHTFLAINPKKRVDLPSESFLTGPAELRDDGKVFSGGKLVAELNEPAAPAP